MKIEKDLTSGWIYLSMNNNKIDHSIEVYCYHVVIDVDEDMNIVGIEFCDVDKERLHDLDDLDSLDT